MWQGQNSSFLCVWLELFIFKCAPCQMVFYGCVSYQDAWNKTSYAYTDINRKLTSSLSLIFNTMCKNFVHFTCGLISRIHPLHTFNDFSLSEQWVQTSGQTHTQWVPPYKNMSKYVLLYMVFIPEKIQTWRWTKGSAKCRDRRRMTAEYTLGYGHETLLVFSVSEW